MLGKPQESRLLELALQKAHHLPNGRFRNPWFHQEAPALHKILKWKLSHLILRERPKFPILRPAKRLLREANPLVCFLGHNSIFLRLGGANILFDPIFSHIGGLVKRHTPPPLPPEELPPVDYLVYSHAHRDHLDLTSLKKITGPKKIITPLGFSRYLTLTNLVELDWFESFEESGIRFTALPLQHWSKRGIADTNCSLWAGFMVEAEGLKIFLSGDTGYFFGFQEIGKLFGPFDLAFLPAGAFLPRWLMAPFHLSPEEAVRAASELKAHQATPIHWGAYKLGDEALDDPPKLFKKAAREEGLKALILYPGEAALWYRGAFRPVEQVPF